MEIIKIPLVELTPDPNNAKDHPEWQIRQIKNSIEEFGNLDPIGIWGDDNLIVEGHGRYEALQELGYNEAECIRLDWLSDEERRAYALAHNKLTMNTGWIPEALDLNLDAIGEIDMGLFGFKSDDWFTNRERNDDSRQDGNEEYNEFLDKFEQAKTTDDCYTPDCIYEAVADWVAKEYKIKKDKFVRPFYPGGNYQKEKYTKDCIVVDNPPFSILSEIEEWYNANGIRYFLFAPNVSNFPSKRKCCSICVGVGVTYENGAKVLTSFVTNMENLVARTAPDLYQIIDKANRENTRTRELPNYEYPQYVVTAAMLSYLSKYGQVYKLEEKDASEKISALDSQRESGKGIFGGGYLISEKAAAEKAAAEKAAAEKAAAEKWELSETEWEIVRRLGGD